MNHVWIMYETKPEIFDEKRGNAALLIKNFGFYFIFNPMESTDGLQRLRIQGLQT